MFDQSSSLMEYILLNYRWVFVCLFLLPISVVYNSVMFVRNYIVFKLSSAPKLHDLKVKYVQKQVKRWKEDGRKTLMCTSRPSWANVSFRFARYKSSLRQIDVNLVDVLEVDVNRRIVRCEPLVTMGQITATLEPLGWSLAVVPELDDLTIGGVVCGEGVESSSHKFGLFQSIIESAELVMADASVVRCSRSENPELFECIPWSHGTVGFLVSVELRIVPASRYVRLQYNPVLGLHHICSEFRRACEQHNDNQFVECLMYGRDEAVVMVGLAKKAV